MKSLQQTLGAISENLSDIYLNKRVLLTHAGSLRHLYDVSMLTTVCLKLLITKHFSLEERLEAYKAWREITLKNIREECDGIEHAIANPVGDPEKWKKWVEQAELSSGIPSDGEEAKVTLMHRFQKIDGLARSIFGFDEGEEDDEDTEETEG